uniref:Uncharacterized protein n=1 Tax=Anguilla anguilla TaxID=7936 RepID=A0A0E9UMG3_ANGAN
MLLHLLSFSTMYILHQKLVCSCSRACVLP